MALRMIAGRTRELALAQLARDLGIDPLTADGCAHPALEAQVQFERRIGGPGWWPFGEKRWELFVDDSAAGAAELRWEPAIAQASASCAAIETEVRALRQGMAQLIRSADLARLPRCGKALTDCYDHLCRIGMLPELAQELVLAAREELSGAAQEQATVVGAAVRRQYQARLQLRTPRVVPGSGPLVIFLVGPTGVGKTTTAAKLAKRQALLEGRRIAIVNADAARPGAQQQLELLLQPLALRVEALARPAELRGCLAGLADRDAVLVDTGGVGRCDDEELSRLGELIAAAPRRQTFLVLSASTSYDEMDHIVAAVDGARPNGARPNGARPDGIILTKIDETDALGAAASLSCRCSIPIAYVSTGRRVPQDLELATAERMSELVLASAGFESTSLQPRRRTSCDAASEAATPPVVPHLTARNSQPAKGKRVSGSSRAGLASGPGRSGSCSRGSARAQSDAPGRGEEIAA